MRKQKTLPPKQYASRITLEIANTFSLSVIVFLLKANLPTHDVPDKYVKRLYTTPLSANQHPLARW